MISRLDDMLKNRKQPANDTAEKILENVPKQEFDVSLDIPSWGRNFKKKYQAYLTENDGRPMVVTLDALSENQREVYVPNNLPLEGIHQVAEKLARDMYQDFLSKVLIENGFERS